MLAFGSLRSVHSFIPVQFSLLGVSEPAVRVQVFHPRIPCFVWSAIPSLLYGASSIAATKRFLYREVVKPELRHESTNARYFIPDVGQAPPNERCLAEAKWCDQLVGLAR